jgi:hypothetical protein
LKSSKIISKDTTIFWIQEKTKTSTIKIKCVEQTARDFITFLERKIPM